MKQDKVNIQVRQAIAANIRACRKATGMNQGEFAQMISLNRGYLSGIENGKENVSVDVLVKIAEGLDVPLTTLFTGLDKNPPRLVDYAHIKLPHVKDDK
jgi:transcriptional regulator with XRE-family HTH domain